MDSKILKAVRFAQNKLAISGKLQITLGQIKDNAASQLDKLQIVLNANNSQDVQIEALFHEIAHFRQFQTGQLAWNGTNWIYQGQIQAGNYWFQLHEVEARKIARQLMLEWNRLSRVA